MLQLRYSLLHLVLLKVAKIYMNNSKVWPLLPICIASIATPLLMNAQQLTKTIAPTPELQKREQGRVTEVKVNNAGSIYSRSSIWARSNARKAKWHKQRRSSTAVTEHIETRKLITGSGAGRAI